MDARTQVIWLLIALGCTNAFAAEKISVGVLNLSSEGEISSEKAEVLTDILAGEISKLEGLQVLSEGDLETLLKFERKKLLLGATERERAEEIGGALGLRWMIGGSIKATESGWLVNLSLSDIERGRVAGTSRRAITAGEEQLLEELPEMVREIFTQSAAELGLVAAVTVASRHPQRLGQSPSAVSVITRQDIQTSGATTIPELLRLVPGMEVIVVSPSYQAITSRLVWTPANIFYLVLIDGRETNIELLGTTFWEMQPIGLEDIERIEVIRGPASALYGANAFAGVVSITTRKIPERSSARVHLSAGEPGATLLDAHASTRLGNWGFSLAGGLDRSGRFDDPGASTREIYRLRALAEYRWTEYRRLFLDTGLSTCTGLLPNAFSTIEGTYQLRTVRIAYDSVSLRGQLIWSQMPIEARLKAPLEYGGLHLADFAPASVDAHTLDGEMQWNLFGSDWLFLVTGASGRLSWLGSDQLLDAATFADTSSPRYHLPGLSHWEARAAGFFHGEIALSERLTLTAGIRLDYNTETDLFVSPRLAAVAKVAEAHYLRLSGGRAFRKPSYMNAGMHPVAVFPEDGPIQGGAQTEFQEFMTRIIGNGDIDNEKLFSVELGYTGEFWEGKIRASADFYWNFFTDEITFDPHIVSGEFGLPNLRLSSYMFGNVGPDYHILGGEAALAYSPRPALSLQIAWAHREVYDTGIGGISPASPKNFVTLGGRWQGDSGILGSLYLFYRSGFLDRDVENPAGLLAPLLSREMPGALLVLARLGWQRRFGDSIEMETGIKLFLPLSPASYRDEGGGVSANGLAFGGERLRRMVSFYLQGAF